MAQARSMPLGPVIIDIAGTVLSDEDRRRLMHPLTGGMILFTRNYESPDQLVALTREIHALREPSLVVCVDHEGGRVQRFRSGLTRLPPMRTLGDAWDRSAQHGRHLARELGFVLASELRAHGVDLSFTPVLDIDHGNSSIIGDRSFHRDVEAVVELGSALMLGLRDGGTAAVGKHFPGHGHVQADSHLELPIDDRPFEALREADLVPFARLIRNGLAAIMPAHVVYTSVDSRPAGFSEVWLKRILREELRFDGLIFSDDLSMEGARATGRISARAQAAFDAGVDMVLVCNDPDAVDELYSELKWNMPAVSLARLARLHGRHAAESMVKLREDPRYPAALHAIAGLGKASGDLPLA
jgi:beta-N-acetylhexosaminidase